METEPPFLKELKSLNKLGADGENERTHFFN